MKQLFFDLETTGTDKANHAIHQIAGIVIIDNEVKERFNIRFQPHPGALIDDKALEVCNKTIDELKGYQHHLAGYSELINVLKKYCDKYNRSDKFFMAGYNNAEFDNPFLRSFFERCGDKYFGSWFWAGAIDVYVLALDYLQDHRTEMSDFKLKSVAKKLNISVDDTRLHDAFYDIELTYDIYQIVTAKRKHEKGL